MTDPYRTVTSPPCLRCRLPLVEDDDKDLACSDGCGRWIQAMTVMRLVGTTDLATLARPVAHWKATPFSAATCPACQTKLTEQYMPMPDGDVLTHGYCTRHGVWLDRGTHADFTTAYAVAIATLGARTHAAAMRDEAPHAAEQIESLEDRVRRLERQVAELRAFVGWDD